MTLHCEEKCPAQDLRVAVVTMQCPAPPETFAARDVLALRRLGASVTIHSLRKTHSDHEALIQSFGLSDIPRSYGGAGAALRGLGLMLRRPVEALRLIGTVILRERGQLRTLIRATAILPRVYEVTAEIEAGNSNIVHCFWGHYPSLVLELMERRRSLRLRSTFLGSYDLLDGLETSRTTAEKAACIFTHAHANMPALRHLGIAPDEVTVVHRGIDVDAISDVDCTRPRDIDILSVCRVIPRKGVRRLIEATRELVQRGYEPRVMVIGTGASLPAMRELVAQYDLSRYIEMTGFRPIADVYDAMSRAQIFSLLSDELNDRLPNVVKEAMYLGCKCIVGESVGIEELVPGPDQGVIVKTQDPGELADIFATALDIPDDLDRRERARQFIVTRFNTLESMKVYCATWQHALSHGGEHDMV